MDLTTHLPKTKIIIEIIDAFKAAKLLKENGNISEDVVLLFDEIHLQQCEDYVDEDMVFS